MVSIKNQNRLFVAAISLFVFYDVMPMFDNQGRILSCAPRMSLKQFFMQNRRLGLLGPESFEQKYLRILDNNDLAMMYVYLCNKNNFVGMMKAGLIGRTLVQVFGQFSVDAEQYLLLLRVASIILNNNNVLADQEAVKIIKFYLANPILIDVFDDAIKNPRARNIFLGKSLNTIPLDKYLSDASSQEGYNQVIQYLKNHDIDGIYKWICRHSAQYHSNQRSPTFWAIVDYSNDVLEFSDSTMKVLFSCNKSMINFRSDEKVAIICLPEQASIVLGSSELVTSYKKGIAQAFGILKETEMSVLDEELIVYLLDYNIRLFKETEEITI